MAFDFNKEVVETSYGTPVLIDFWAPWCGPCKTLGPILEELEKNAKGRWKLIKINTEEEEQIAAYFQIRSIPNCKLVFEGKIVDEFSGVQSKDTIEKWLDAHFKTLGIEEVVVEEAVDNFAELLDIQKTIPDISYYNSIIKFLDQNPDHEEANIIASRHELFIDKEKFLTRVKSIKENHIRENLTLDSEVVFEFLENEFHAATKEDGLVKEVKAHYLKSEQETMLEKIIEGVQRYPSYRESFFRRLGIAFFRTWGSSYPLTKEYRRLFDMAIY